MLSGAAVRFRFYTRWGVGALELSRIVLFQTTTFWLGLLVLGGATLGFAPHPWLRDLPGAPLVRGLGLVLLGLGLAYAVLPLVRRAPLRLGRLEVPVPTAAARGGAVRAVDPRLGPRRRRPAGAAAAERGAVRRAARGVPRGAARGAREPRAGRARGLRDAHGPRPQALPARVVGPAGPRALPRRLLPAAPGGRPGAARRGRGARAAGADRVAGGSARHGHPRGGPAAPRGVHLPGRGGPPLLGGDPVRSGPGRVDVGLPAPAPPRGLALPRQPRGGRAPPRVPRRVAPARRGLLPRGARASSSGSWPRC